MGTQYPEHPPAPAAPGEGSPTVPGRGVPAAGMGWPGSSPRPAGAQPWPAAPPAPPEPGPVRGRRRWLWIALAVVAALLVAGGVAAVAGTGGSVTLPALPDTLDGARRSTDPNAVKALDAQVATLRAEPGVTSTDAAVYDGPGASDRFLVVLAAAGRKDPDRTVADVIEGARSSGGATGMTFADSDPGPLGGALTCGSGDLQGTPFSFCAWAADRVVGVVLSYNRRAANGAGLTRTVRAGLGR